MIPLSNPDLTELEVQRVNEVLKSPNLSGGPHKKEFETKLAQVAGTKFAVAVSSGTAALHLILLSLGIGPGDEVITTPFSFIASANCILYVGAKPVFCDITPDDLNINPDLIEEKITLQTKAILVVHVFGVPVRMDEIAQIAAKHDLYVIEDACEAIGATWNGRPVGGIGIAGAFAFYPNKQITTGEGGAVVTNEKNLADRIRSLANQGRDDSSQWLHHVQLGYNYRLNELSAALGCAQLDRLPEILRLRAQVAGWYDELLRGEPLITTPGSFQSKKALPSWFVYVIRFCDPNLRSIIALRLEELGIETRPYFPAIHLQPVYHERFGYTAGTFPETEKAALSGLALPFFTKISREMVTNVCTAIRSTLYLPEVKAMFYG